MGLPENVVQSIKYFAEKHWRRVRVLFLLTVILSITVITVTLGYQLNCAGWEWLIAFLSSFPLLLGIVIYIMSYVVWASDFGQKKQIFRFILLTFVFAYLPFPLAIMTKYLYSMTFVASTFFGVSVSGYAVLALVFWKTRKKPVLRVQPD